MAISHASSDEPGSSDLARRLIADALNELHAVPSSEISLRRIAQRLGVSHQAPYVHFGGKRGFLAAVAGVGLAEAARKAADDIHRAGPDPHRQAHALVNAYVEFASRQPHLHDLAFGPTVAKSDHPSLQRAANDYWELLRSVTMANQARAITEAELLRRCTVFWGTIYGISRLAAAGQIPASVPGPTDDIIHASVDLLIEGWR